VEKHSGNYLKAQQWAAESLALRRTLGDKWGTGNVLAEMGSMARDLGELDRSERMLREAIQIHESAGFRGAESGEAHDGLGNTLMLLGRFSEAYASLREAATRYEDAGIHIGYFWSTLNLGWACQNLGNYVGARDYAWKAQELSRPTESLIEIACPLATRGSISLAEEGCPNEALLLESLAIFEELGDLGWVSHACSLLGFVAREQDDGPKARGHLEQALRYAVETKAWHPVVTSLAALALLLADQGDAERAVELYALASSHPYVANSRWFEDIAGKEIAAVAATLPPDVVAAAQERGRARDLWDTAAELLQELEDADANCANSTGNHTRGQL
jgi:tetratricopeptide (TPR) repeat protein